jgi:hypothetical protein
MPVAARVDCNPIVLKHIFKTGALSMADAQNQGHQCYKNQSLDDSDDLGYTPFGFTLETFGAWGTNLSGPIPENNLTLDDLGYTR